MKFFVAGSWNDRENVHKAILLVREAGHKISHDWTRLDAHSVADRVHISTLDFRGIAEADIVVFLATCPSSTGSYLVEFGIALALGKPIWLIGNQMDNGLYAYHPAVRRAKNIEEIIAYYGVCRS